MKSYECIDRLGIRNFFVAILPGMHPLKFILCWKLQEDYESQGKDAEEAAKERLEDVYLKE
jgi:hypothetical protein